MDQAITSKCPRCGKERVKGKADKLIVNTVATVRYVFICPDKECQKIVEEVIAAKIAKKLLLQTSRESRRSAVNLQKTPATNS